MQVTVDDGTTLEVEVTGTLTNALPVKSGETWQSTYTGLTGASGIILTFT